MTGKEPQKRPQQEQQPPGTERKMRPPAESMRDDYRGSGKLEGKVALISGGDSGIGRATAIHFAREGADVAIVYLCEHKDAEDTREMIEDEDRRCILMAGDVGDKDFCNEAVKRTLDELGRLDILVNNSAEQHPQTEFEQISAEQLEKTFRTNIFGMFYLTQAALPALSSGSAIINSTSVTAYRGNPSLIDYSSTKGAIVSFTRSLALALAERDIRVNAVAPGPIWTPLIPSTFPKEKVAKFGADKPLKRAGQPAEVAPSFVFLACADSSYMTGQVLHPNGGDIVNG